MGLFGSIAGIIGGTKPATVPMSKYDFLSKLPKSFQEQGERMAGTSLSLTEALMGAGETPEAASLFAGAREKSIGRFGDVMGNLGSQLHRYGAGSSTGADVKYRQLSSNLLNQLATMDMQRAMTLSDKQTQAGQMSISNLLAMAGQTDYVQKQEKLNTLGKIGAGLDLAPEFVSTFGGMMGGMGGGSSNWGAAYGGGDMGGAGGFAP